MSFRPAISLAGDPSLPVFLRIARAITDDIRRGRLRPSAPLPGSRTLAEDLGVHRNTVIAAYRELAAEGWIEARPAGGTFVSSSLPDPEPRRFAEKATPRAAMPERLGYDLAPLPELHEIGAPTPLPPGTLSLQGGVPDLRLVPSALIARAYRRVLARRGRSVLAYGDPRGDERLRAALASMLSTLRGLAAGPESVFVTRGSQMALELLARALVAPGDVVAVEGFGYRPAWNALRTAGARLVPIPVDGEGLCVDKLAELCAREKVRAVYVTPHHQYPTTVVLAAGRRLELLRLARERRIAVIEDDYDNEFHYDGRPVLPLASADGGGNVAYIGTLSKLLAPGLRIGFLVAPVPLVERVAALRMGIDRQGDHAVEAAVAELYEDGEIARHARRVTRAYHARRDALAGALRAALGDVVDFDLPAGGMALWARVSPDIDIADWVQRARAGGVIFSAGRSFAFDGRARPNARFGYACLDEKELQEAVRRAAAALPAGRKSAPHKPSRERSADRPATP